MDYLFLDTSVFLKLYIAEKGSAWLTNYIVGKQPIISELALFESATALRKRQLDGTLTKIAASSLYAQILQDRFNFEIVTFGLAQLLNEVVNLAFKLPGNFRLRALDAIQLASAGIAQVSVIQQPSFSNFTFLSSDLQLLKVAQAQNLATENPEDYP